jgi:hypothetical protein
MARVTDEVKQEYVRAMGAELGAVYCGLWGECVALHWKWSQFVALFGTKQERLNLLNGAARSFFRLVQDCLREDVLLHISRLTDSPKVGKKTNLSVRRLTLLVSPQLAPALEKVVQSCLVKCEFARDWRNRRVAHIDLDLAMMDKPVTPLAIATRKGVSEALESIATVLDTVRVHYLGGKMGAWTPDPTPGNAISLLSVLRDGLEAEQARRERLKSGNYLPGDVGPASPI